MPGSWLTMPMLVRPPSWAPENEFVRPNWLLTRVLLARGPPAWNTVLVLTARGPPIWLVKDELLRLPCWTVSESLSLPTWLVEAKLLRAPSWSVVAWFTLPTWEGEAKLLRPSWAMKEELVAPRPAWLTTPTLVPRPCWISVAELLWAKAAPERVRVERAAIRAVRRNMGRSPGGWGWFGDLCSAPMSPFYPPPLSPSVIEVTFTPRTLSPDPASAPDFPADRPHPRPAW